MKSFGDGAHRPFNGVVESYVILLVLLQQRNFEMGCSRRGSDSYKPAGASARPGNPHLMPLALILNWLTN